MPGAASRLKFCSAAGLERVRSLTVTASVRAEFYRAARVSKRSPGLIFSDRLAQVADRDQTPVERRYLLHVELQALDVIEEIHTFLHHRTGLRVRSRRIENIRLHQHFFFRQIADQHGIRVVASLKGIDLQ